MGSPRRAHSLLLALGFCPVSQTTISKQTSKILSAVVCAVNEKETPTGGTYFLKHLCIVFQKQSQSLTLTCSCSSATITEASLWGIPYGVEFSTNIYQSFLISQSFQTPDIELKEALLPVLSSSKACVSNSPACPPILLPQEDYDYQPFPHLPLNPEPPLALGSFEPISKGDHFGQTKP